MGGRLAVGAVVFGAIAGLVVGLPEGGSLAHLVLGCLGVWLVVAVLGRVRPQTPIAGAWSGWTVGNRAAIAGPVAGALLGAMVGSSVVASRSESSRREAEAKAAQASSKRKREAEAVAHRDAAIQSALTVLTDAQMASLEPDLVAMEAAVQRGQWDVAHASRERLARYFEPIASVPPAARTNHPAFVQALRFASANALLERAESDLLPAIADVVSVRGELRADRAERLAALAKKRTVSVAFVQQVFADHVREIDALVLAKRKAFDSEVFEYVFDRVWGGADDAELDPAVRKAVRKFGIPEERVRMIVAARNDEILRREQVKKAAEQKAMEKQCGPVPERDGKYLAHAYLMRVANDPGSLDMGECSKLLYYEDRCYETTCTFRGKNAFGATVLNAARFQIKFGAVSKYRPID